jgi:hypothetical protein
MISCYLAMLLLGWLLVMDLKLHSSLCVNALSLLTKNAANVNISACK